MKFIFVLILFFLLCLDCNSKNIKEIQILFLGDSLTSGHGLVNKKKSFSHLLAKSLQKDFPNAFFHFLGESGDTTIDGYNRFLSLKNKNYDVLVLELGANDSFRGVPNDKIEENLSKIIEELKFHNSDARVLLLGFLPFELNGVPFMMGMDQVYLNVQKKYSTELISSFLKNVFGKRSLNQPDGIHPNEMGHKIVAETVLPTLKKILLESSK